MTRTLQRIILIAMTFISACSSSKNESAECPKILVDFDVMKASFFEGESTSIRNEKYKVEIDEALVECKSTDKDLLVRIEPEFKIVAGMAMKDKAEFSYFIAVINKNNKEILSKQVFDMSVSLGNTGFVLTKDKTDIKIDIKGGNIYDYQIYVGLQINEQQLEFNRSKKLWLN